MNLDEYKSVGIVLYVNGNNRICFASFGAENITKEIKTFLGNKNVTKIFIEYSAIMLEYFCVGFIDFMFKEKSMRHFTNLLSANNFKYNDKVYPKLLLKFFNWNWYKNGSNNYLWYCKYASTITQRDAI